MEDSRPLCEEKKYVSASTEPTMLPAAQMEDLLVTNRALRDVIIELHTLLKDPSRNAAYPVPQRVGTPIQSSRPATPSKPSATDRIRMVDEPQWIEAARVIRSNSEHGLEKAQSMQLFEAENRRARERHQERRRREMMLLKNKASYKYVSFPSTFYHGEVESFHRTREYVGADPHHWWHRLHHHQQPPDKKGKPWWLTWLRPHHRRDKMLDPGPHVEIGSGGAMRDELLDALFNFDSTWPEHLLHTLPLRELEHTYGYKLYRSKALVPGIERPNNELIIEVGRFFKDLADEMSRSDEHRLMLDVKRKFSLASLYQRCYERGVLKIPEGSPESQIRASMALIWNVLHVFNHVAILPRSLSAISDLELNSFILDLLDQHYIRDGAPDHKFPAPAHLADDSHFLPKELCFKTLTELGGLKIEWTNQYTQHLRLIRSSKKLMLFWDVSIFGQSPLFVHWPLWLNHGSPSSAETASLKDYSVDSTSLLDELKRSYRIIFGNPDGRFLERFFRKHFGRAGDEIGILLRDVENLMLGGGITRVNISRSSARQALKYYFRAPIPRSIRNVRPELDRKRHRGPQRGPNINFYLRKPTSGKLIDLLNAGPPFALDFWMHISYLLEISQSVGLSEMERYSAYPIYGDRLQELKAYMDKQRPKNLRQLYKDRRDTVGYWAFWAVVFVGGASIILALISIAVSSAQAVASFKALGPLHDSGSGHHGRQM